MQIEPFLSLSLSLLVEEAMRRRKNCIHTENYLSLTH